VEDGGGKLGPQHAPRPYCSHILKESALGGKENRQKSLKDEEKEKLLMVSDKLRRKFQRLTPIQEKAIPLILKGENVLITAPTGYGKTEASALPVMDRIKGKKGIGALYITPLRALNRDLERRLKEWAREFGINIAVRHSDTPVEGCSKEQYGELHMQCNKLQVCCCSIQCRW